MFGSCEYRIKTSHLEVGLSETQDEQRWWWCFCWVFPCRMVLDHTCFQTTWNWYSTNFLHPDVICIQIWQRELCIKSAHHTGSASLRDGLTSLKVVFTSASSLLKLIMQLCQLHLRSNNQCLWVGLKHSVRASVLCTLVVSDKKPSFATLYVCMLSCSQWRIGTCWLGMCPCFLVTSTMLRCCSFLPVGRLLHWRWSEFINCHL